MREALIPARAFDRRVKERGQLSSSWIPQQACSNADSMITKRLGMSVTKLLCGKPYVHTCMYTRSKPFWSFMPVEFGWKYEVLVEAIAPLATVRN